MKLQDLIANYQSWRDKEREPLRRLVKLFCPVSRAELHKLEDDWHYRRPVPPYEEFVVAQNKKIDLCIQMEMSEFGTAVRKQFNLPPLTNETEI